MTKQMDMTPTDIRIAMLKAGVTQACIARELGVHKGSVLQVLEGRWVSDRIRRKIAERCGLDVARIWPSTYLFGGPRKPGRPFCHPVKKAAEG
jgi:lambda repressor-like predicted transcriptional regulator